MDPFAPPEVQRAALEGPLLQVLALGIPLQRWGSGKKAERSGGDSVEASHAACIMEEAC